MSPGIKPGFFITLCFEATKVRANASSQTIKVTLRSHCSTNASTDTAADICVSTSIKGKRHITVLVHLWYIHGCMRQEQQAYTDQFLSILICISTVCLPQSALFNRPGPQVGCHPPCFILGCHVGPKWVCPDLKCPFPAKIQSTLTQHDKNSTLNGYLWE